MSDKAKEDEEDNNDLTSLRADVLPVVDSNEVKTIKLAKLIDRLKKDHHRNVDTEQLLSRGKVIHCNFSAGIKV